MDPHEYEGKVLTIEGVDQEIPKFSEWKRVGKCCCFNIAYFPKIKSYFINQWEVNCSYPVVVLILFIASFVAGILAAIETFDGAAKIAVIIIFSLIFVLWFSSYMMAMCRSPGYLPFYWAVERREKYTYEEQMDGIITNDEQFGFAKCNDRPERGSLSMQARRLVVRADHVCRWISNWVGYKNYRFFYLQLFWTFFTFVVFFVICAFEIVDMADHYENTAARIMIFILALPDIGFFIFFMQIFFRHTRYLFHNETTLGEFKKKTEKDKHNYYDIGCCNNIEETCGKCAWCPLYLCPIPLPRVNDGFHWKVNTKTNPNELPKQPKVTLEYARACPTLDDYKNNGKKCPPYPPEKEEPPAPKPEPTPAKPAPTEKPAAQEPKEQDIENVSPAVEL